MLTPDESLIYLRAGRVIGFSAVVCLLPGFAYTLLPRIAVVSACLIFGLAGLPVFKGAGAIPSIAGLLSRPGGGPDVFSVFLGEEGDRLLRGGIGGTAIALGLVGSVYALRALGIWFSSVVLLRARGGQDDNRYLEARQLAVTNPYSILTLLLLAPLFGEILIGLLRSLLVVWPAQPNTEATLTRVMVESAVGAGRIALVSASLMLLPFAAAQLLGDLFIVLAGRYAPGVVAVGAHTVIRAVLAVALILILASVLERHFAASIVSTLSP